MSVARSGGRTGRRLIAEVVGAGVAGLAAAGGARYAYSALMRRPPGGEKTWSRTNHRGEAVTLLEGPAVVAGAIAGVLAQAGVRSLAGSPCTQAGVRSLARSSCTQAGVRSLAGSPRTQAGVRSVAGSYWTQAGLRSAAGSSRTQAAWRVAAAMTVAGAGAAAFGAYDDLSGSSDRRGFRGHLGALRHGEVTTGAVKLAGIGVTGLASAALTCGSPGDVVVNAGLVAGFANLLNLFDLRPGRAIKAALASGALIAGSSRRGADTAGEGSTAAALVPPLAAALALLPEDLGERAMLGDAGANAVGAMLGAAACGLPRPARVALLAGIASLTAASEKVSFTAVIERTPALHRLDMLGRRPAGPAPAVRIPVQRSASEHPEDHRGGQRRDAKGKAGGTDTDGPPENTDVAPPRE